MNEVDQIIVRTTFSTILSEGRDFACILTDRHARSLCQSTLSTATFTKVYPRTAKALLERFPVEALQEGDVLATNDPWLGTGHLPDYILLRPVFWRGEVVAFLGTVSHMSDVGGHEAEIESFDVFSEGLCMPPFKLYEAGVENALAFSVMGANCRVPESPPGRPARNGRRRQDRRRPHQRPSRRESDRFRRACRRHPHAFGERSCVGGSKRSRTAYTSMGWTSMDTSKRLTSTRPSRFEAATSTSTMRAARRSGPTPRSTTRTTARTRRLSIPSNARLRRKRRITKGSSGRSTSLRLKAQS